MLTILSCIVYCASHIKIYFYSAIDRVSNDYGKMRQHHTVSRMTTAVEKDNSVSFNVFSKLNVPKTQTNNATQCFRCFTCEFRQSSYTCARVWLLLMLTRSVSFPMFMIVIKNIHSKHVIPSSIAYIGQTEIVDITHDPVALNKIYSMVEQERKDYLEKQLRARIHNHK